MRPSRLARAAAGILSPATTGGILTARCVSARSARANPTAKNLACARFSSANQAPVKLSLGGKLGWR